MGDVNETPAILERLQVGWSRRTFMKRAALFGLAVPAMSGLLAACGDSDDDDDDDTGQSGSATQTPSTQAPTATTAAGGATTTVGGAATADTGSATTEATSAPEETPTAADDEGSLDSQLVIAQVSDLQALYPGVYTSRQSANIMLQVYEGLVLREDDMEFIPGLAESWERVDNTTWRFNLRSDVTFQNGKPFVAEDVKLSFEEGANHPETGVYRYRSFLQEVKVIDDTTIDVITSIPYSPLLTKIVNMEVMNAETYTEVGVEGLSEQPVGTGPFRFMEWKQGERVVVEAYEDYWGGRPKLGTVVFVPIAENATRTAALESGTVQIAAEVPAEYAKTPREGVEIATVDGTRLFFVGLNVEFEPLSDPKARQAMNYGVNVPEIVEALLDGKAEVLHQPAFKKMFGYSDKIEGYHYDPDQAKQLLAEAGLEDGFSATLDVAPTFKEIAEAIAGQLSAINVSIEVNVMDPQALTEKYNSGASEMYFSSWGVSELDPDNPYSNHFLSTRPQVYTHYSRPDVDDLITRAAGEVDDTERLRLYEEVTQIIVDDAPWIFLYTPAEIYGVRTSVSNWNPRSDSRFNLMETTVAAE
ncbi:MAG TPA: ABC transporter substrate-binding protein [Thermomicrobiales bacterium]|nr:ABC transporter substrate-binding protein [Thermomicrobiales bacterium]